MGALDITPIEPADHADASAAHPRRLTVIADDRSARRAAPARRPAGSGSQNQGPEVETGSVREPQARRGPLLAVCGLCGGAGTSTLAYLIALFTARRHSDPVLVCDTGGPDGGLADHAGVAAPRSLVEVAEHVTTGLPPGRVYVTGANGVRVLATGPRFTPDCAADGVKLVLDDARGAHALTVVDCGTLTRAAEQIALAAASHIAWVLPATGPRWMNSSAWPATVTPRSSLFPTCPRSAMPGMTPRSTPPRFRCKRSMASSRDDAVPVTARNERAPATAATAASDRAPPPGPTPSRHGAAPVLP